MWNSEVPNIKENTKGFQWLNNRHESGRNMKHVEI
jgi:hypothetical protein